MSAKSTKKGNKPRSNEEIHRAMHLDALEIESVVELGPTTPTQGALFERIRTGITPAEVLKHTFDAAVKKRVGINHEGDIMPRKVDEATFDADVLKIQHMTDIEAEKFDDEIMTARMEMWSDGGGVFVDQNRASGFGRDVFGFAYDTVSGKWSMTNEHGLHGHCEQNLQWKLNDRSNSAIISGLIFQLPSIQTPVMNPMGYMYMPRILLMKAVKELWAWKRFILITSIEVAPRKYAYKQLFTPEYAEKVCSKMC